MASDWFGIRSFNSLVSNNFGWHPIGLASGHSIRWCQIILVGIRLVWHPVIQFVWCQRIFGLASGHSIRWCQIILIGHPIGLASGHSIRLVSFWLAHTFGWHIRFVGFRLVSQYTSVWDTSATVSLWLAYPVGWFPFGVSIHIRLVNIRVGVTLVDISGWLVSCFVSIHIRLVNIRVGVTLVGISGWLVSCFVSIHVRLVNIRFFVKNSNRSYGQTESQNFALHDKEYTRS